MNNIVTEIPHFYYPDLSNNYTPPSTAKISWNKSYKLNTPCKCGHDRAILKPNKTHSAGIHCQQCDRWLAWLKSSPHLSKFIDYGDRRELAQPVQQSLFGGLN